MKDRESRLPSTAALSAFSAAARHLSFTRAAHELGQTQGAVSHQIRELEQRLRARLFRRETRGISLTSDGQAYLSYVDEALTSLRAGASALKRSSNDNVLTVSMSPNFAAKWLVPRLGDFAAANPALDLRISAAMEHVTFDGDGIDLAIRHGEGHWPDLHVTRLCAEVMFPVCSPQLIQQVGGIDSLPDLLALPLLHDRDHSHWQQWLQTFGVALDDPPQATGAVFNQASLAIDAAVAGQGVALARSTLAALDLASMRLVRPLDEQRSAKFAYWIVCPQSLVGVAKVTRFKQWLVAEAEKDRAGLTE